MKSDGYPIRVLHVLNSLMPSGMERMLLSGHLYFERLGVETLILGQGLENPFKSELVSAGLEVITIPKKITGSPILYMKLLKNMSIDVVHIHTEHAYPLITLLSRIGLGRNKRIVRTIHNHFNARGWWGIKRQFYSRMGDVFVNSVVAPIDSIANLEVRFGRKCKVINNWVDEQFFHMNRNRSNSERIDKPIVLLLGNCGKFKNHEFILEVAKDCNMDLIHIGSEKNASLREIELLQELRNESKLFFCGTANPIDYFKIADLFVMPSLQEGMPVSLVEAIVSNLPCLVSDKPGLMWAEDFDGVTVLPLEKSLWIKQIENFFPLSTQSKVDQFSPEHAAFEYTSLYLDSNSPY